MAISLQCRRNLGVHDSTSSSFSSFSSFSSICSSISRAAFGKVQTADPLGVRVFGPDAPPRGNRREPARHVQPCLATGPATSKCLVSVRVWERPNIQMLSGRKIMIEKKSNRYGVVQRRMFVAVATISVIVLACMGSPPDKPKTPADVFMETFAWRDMETIEVFQDRFPSGVFFRHESRRGETREVRANFPGGGTIVLLARPCSPIAGSGLCVWTVDVE